MKDIVIISTNFGKSGPYINNLTGVNILFNTGDEFGLDATGVINIPTSATSFMVKKNDNPIGAYILFYARRALPPVEICNNTAGDEDDLANCGDPDCLANPVCAGADYLSISGMLRKELFL